jgi:hypothetical protein
LASRIARHALVEPLAGDAAALHRRDNGVDGAFAIGGHQQDVGAGFESADRRFAGVEELRQAQHVHGVGDDEAAEAELVAQRVREQRR